jgi:hypothetical protein
VWNCVDDCPRAMFPSPSAPPFPAMYPNPSPAMYPGWPSPMMSPMMPPAYPPPPPPPPPLSASFSSPMMPPMNPMNNPMVAMGPPPGPPMPMPMPMLVPAADPAMMPAMSAAPVEGQRVSRQSKSALTGLVVLVVIVIVVVVIVLLSNQSSSGTSTSTSTSTTTSSSSSSTGTATTTTSSTTEPVAPTFTPIDMVDRQVFSLKWVDTASTERKRWSSVLVNGGNEIPTLQLMLPGDALAPNSDNLFEIANWDPSNKSFQLVLPLMETIAPSFDGSLRVLNKGLGITTTPSGKRIVAWTAVLPLTPATEARWRLVSLTNNQAGLQSLDDEKNLLTHQTTEELNQQSGERTTFAMLAPWANPLPAGQRAQALYRPFPTLPRYVLPDPAILFRLRKPSVAADAAYIARDSRVFFFSGPTNAVTFEIKFVSARGAFALRRKDLNVLITLGPSGTLTESSVDWSTGVQGYTNWAHQGPRWRFVEGRTSGSRVLQLVGVETTQGTFRIPGLQYVYNAAFSDYNALYGDQTNNYDTAQEFTLEPV